MCRCLCVMLVILKYIILFCLKNKVNNYKLELNFGNIVCLFELLLYFVIYGLFNWKKERNNYDMNFEMYVIKFLM